MRHVYVFRQASRTNNSKKRKYSAKHWKYSVNVRLYSARVRELRSAYLFLCTSKKNMTNKISKNVSIPQGIFCEHCEWNKRPVEKLG